MCDTEIPAEKMIKVEVVMVEAVVKKYRRKKRRGKNLTEKPSTQQPPKSSKQKTTGPNCECRAQCTAHFTDAEKQRILYLVYHDRPKNESDTYLMGLIERHDVVRHRPSTENSRQNTSSFTYFAMKGCKRTEVCRKAYLSLHGLSNRAVQRLNRLIETDSRPIDMRGKHGKRATKISPEITDRVHQHVMSFPVFESQKSPTDLIIYLEPGFTVKNMYQSFVEANPDLANQVKYNFYLNYLKKNFQCEFLLNAKNDQES